MIRYIADFFTCSSWVGGPGGFLLITFGGVSPGVLFAFKGLGSN